MKILMIAESFLPKIGGLQYQLKYLTEEMAKQNIDIYLMSCGKGDDFLVKNNRGFPKFIEMKSRSIIFRIFDIFQIYRYIKKIRPDIIHIHSAEIFAFNVSLLKRLGLIFQPLIVTSHGIDIMTYPSIGYGLRRYKIFSLILKLILKTCDIHTLVGKTMLPFALDSGSTKSKIIEINNGVPSEDKYISNEKYDLTTKKFSIKEDDFIMLSLSGMRTLKGIDILVKSLAQIKKEVPSVKLLLACESSDNYDQKIKKIISDLGLKNDVSFIGFITNEEEKIALIRRCDVFCKPSRLEACSVAVLEAMKEGKVVVASIPGGIDIISDKIDGILVETENHISFAKAVIEIYKNGVLRKKIEEGARNNIKNFYIEKIASKYSDLYSEIINTNKCTD